MLVLVKIFARAMPLIANKGSLVDISVLIGQYSEPLTVTIFPVTVIL